MSEVVEARPKPVARRPKAELGPLRELHPKHRLLIQYVVHGVDKPHLLDGIERKSPTEDNPDATRPLKVGEPLRLEEAARVLGMRLKHARHLYSQQVFQKAYNAECEALRNGAKVDAIRRTIEIMNDPGDGSAAWAKVNLAAAGQILGDSDGSGGGKGGVNVTVNTAIQLQPGIVVRLPASAGKPPLEIDGEATEIDGEE